MGGKTVLLLIYRLLRVRQLKKPLMSVNDRWMTTQLEGVHYVQVSTAQFKKSWKILATQNSTLVMGNVQQITWSLKNITMYEEWSVRPFEFYLVEVEDKYFHSCQALSDIKKMKCVAAVITTCHTSWNDYISGKVTTLIRKDGKCRSKCYFCVRHSDLGGNLWWLKVTDFW